MPKKDKSRKKKTGNEGSRELVLKEDGQEYATLGRALGGGKFKAMCQDGKERMCIIRNAMRNRVFVHEGDLILLGLREFSDGTGDIISKYTPEEARKLKKMGQITLDSNE